MTDLPGSRSAETAPGLRGRLALCFGTRPQVVKASALLVALEKEWEVVAIDTGQHYDWELNGLLYQQLGVRPPDLFLEVGSSDHATQTAEILKRTGRALEKCDPRAVIVIGDTNSTLGCALAAAKQRRTLIHVEAGLRAADFGLPEDINRRVVDELSSVLCAPSRRSFDFLSQRVAPDQQVYFTGDVARDVLERALASASQRPEPWKEKGIDPPFLLVTLHRAEITGRAEWLAAIMQALGATRRSVFFPAHPRTLEALRLHGLLSRIPDNVHLASPVGYLELVGWARGAEMILTDSGGLQREAYWLGIPCITIREETEWKETVEEAANVVLSPADATGLSSLLTTHPGLARDWDRDAYGEGNAAELIREVVGGCLA